MSMAKKQASRNLKNQRCKETAQMGDSISNFVSIGSRMQLSCWQKKWQKFDCVQLLQSSSWLRVA